MLNHDKLSFIKNIISEELAYSHYEFGFADLRGLLPEYYSSYLTGISIINKLNDSVIDTIKDGPTIEYYNLYNTVNIELNEKMSSITEKIESLGISVFIVNATIKEEEITEEFRKTLRYPISHKMVATRAGLGWIGKTDLFISKKYGPRVRLASILLDLKPDFDVIPVEESLCGNCTVCVKNCPAEAATGKLWNISTERDEFFNAFKCLQTCRSLSRKKLNKESTVCGICVALCPRGVK